jgi:hypothetical protein
VALDDLQEEEEEDNVLPSTKEVTAEDSQGEEDGENTVRSVSTTLICSNGVSTS